MKLLVLVPLLALIQSTHSQSVKEEFDKMSWLVGNWKGMANGKPFYEAWRRLNDSMYANFSIEIKDKDTIVSLGSPLHWYKQSLWLGEPPAMWKLTKLTKDEIILENDTLKYSNKITWQHTKSDHWFTELKHPKSTVKYDLVRMPELEAVVERFYRKMKKQ